jgi:hypothetical protein
MYMQVLMLSGHNFTGTLPTSWTRLQQLRVLDVFRNSLTGSLPSWYVSMRQLAMLKVHNNKLVKLKVDTKVRATSFLPSESQCYFNELGVLYR